MLLQLAVENFKSYKERTVFSMEAGEGLNRFDKENTLIIGDDRVLKSAYIFGANASGKTNLLHAIAFLSIIVINTTFDSTSLILRMPFVTDPTPTKFEIIFLRKGRKYFYTLQYDDTHVVGEELFVDDKCVFRRDGQEVSVISMREGLQTLRKNQLLLYWAQDKNIPEAVEAFSWFKNDVVNLINKANEERQFREAEKKMLEDPSLKERILSILRAADFNIVDYDFVVNAQAIANVRSAINGPWSMMRDIPEAFRAEIMSDAFSIYNLQTIHRIKGQEVKFPLVMESIGTQRFLQILINIFLEVSDGKVFLIDEFDRSLHPEMVKILVKMMNRWNKGNQFIVTTHQFDVMDLNLRSDQIYFADKNYGGVSELYSIFDFADPALKENDVSFKKLYLEGMYGATQIVNEPELEEIFSDQES